MKRPGVWLVILATLLGGLLVLIVYADSIALSLQKPFAAHPGPDGEVTILLKDFEFSPAVVRVKAGSTVRLRLRNVGMHTHEFMLGKEVHVEKGVFEPPTPDFFEGLTDIQVEVVKGMAMPMGLGHEEKMGGMGMGAGEKTSMGGMEMGKPKEGGGGMPMGEKGMEMAGMERPGPHAEGMEMEMGEHHGGMVMLDPGSEVVLTMTIPEDRVGTWVFGCFQEEGLHYDSGMRGVLIVEP